MKKLSIRAKILLGLLTIVFITVLMGSVSMLRTRVIGTDAKQITGKFIPSVNALSAMQGKLNDLNALEYKAVYRSSRPEVAKRVSEMKALHSEIDRLAQVYNSLLNNTKEKELYKTFREDFSKYLNQNET